MSNPKFVQFGAVTTLPAPYLCESAELYGFFFRADHERLLELCKKVFQEPTGGAVDYRPFGAHLLLTFGRIKRIRPQTPPFDEWGTLAEDQVVIWIPVVAVDDSGALLHAGKFAMFVPYIWLDDPLSFASGREAGGWPKSWGWPVFSKPDQPLRLELDVYGWQFGPEKHPRRRQLLSITEVAGPNGDEASAFDSLGELFGDFRSTVWDDDGFMIPELDLVPDLLRTAFRAELPGVHPQVDVVNSVGAIAAVRDEAADVGFVEGLEPLDGLDLKVVARDRIVLVVAADHRWAHRRTVNPRELMRGRWISRESGSGMRAVATAALAEVGVELEPDLSLASLEGVKRSLAAGGFALISELAVEPDLASGRLVTLPLKGLTIERSLIAIRRAGGRPHEQARRFWAWLPAVD